MTEPARRSPPAGRVPLAADLELDVDGLGPVRGRVRAAEPSPGHRLGGHQARQRLVGRACRRGRPGGPVGGQLLVDATAGPALGHGLPAAGPGRRRRRWMPSALDAFTGRVRDGARGQRLGWVRMEPEAADTPALRAALAASGWVPAPHVQPERTLHHRPRPRTRRRSWRAMHRKCRQSIAKSERLGVRVVESGEERLGEFYAIHTDAMTRAGIATRTEAHLPGHVGRSWHRGAWPGCCSRRTAATGAALATLFLVSCGPRVGRPVRRHHRGGWPTARQLPAQVGGHPAMP